MKKMNLAFIGFTVGVVEEIIFAVSILLVHGIIKQEHKIDKPVFKEMKKKR